MYRLADETGLSLHPHFNMDRKAIILHSWDATYDQEGWYPPLKMALEGIQAEQAAWKPSKEIHSIWELVNHLFFYKNRFLHRLENRPFLSSIQTNHETFLLEGNATETAWNARVNELGETHRQIRQKLQQLADADLDTFLENAPIGGQAMSLILHDAYHTGQILFLRKLQHTWPEQRE